MPNTAAKAITAQTLTYTVSKSQNGTTDKYTLVIDHETTNGIKARRQRKNHRSVIRLNNISQRTTGNRYCNVTH